MQASLQLLATLELPSIALIEELAREGTKTPGRPIGCPNVHWPSDHLMLCAVFELIDKKSAAAAVGEAEGGEADAVPAAGGALSKKAKKKANARAKKAAAAAAAAELAEEELGDAVPCP